ncbi:MAG: prepilin-type N-terminal cleavage/methylation domain-containing protein [Nitrospirae bacterium]|nr:prepilin-type N-terminal cleavage/methylation domain-containing protein [Nitrospirota bacterium]
MDSNKGFTLVELIIVITIIGILAMLAVPAYVGQQQSATRSEAYQNLEALRLLEEQRFAENAAYAPDPPGALGAAGASQPGNIALIQGVLTGFQPGPAANLSFSYQIVSGQQITGANPLAFGALAGCFTAIATGNTASRVTNETFAIDCNNNKNF